MLRSLITAGLVLLTLAGSAQAAVRGPLNHDGRFITDADGRRMLMHGTNMINKRPPYAPDALGFGEDDAQFLQDAGYNTIRLGVIYAGVEPQPGVYDDAYLDRIAKTVALLGRHGIFSMLDFHQDLYNERFQGEGWPDWAVFDGGLPAEPKQGFPTNYLVMPALQRAFDSFWDNVPGPGGVGIQDRYAAAWRHVADRFKDDPNVMGYDLLNEPWPGTAWQQCANPVGCPEFDGKLSAFTERMIRAIRTVDRRSLVWYEPNVLFNNGPETQLRDFGDRALGMSFHVYCLAIGSNANNDPSNGDACDPQDELVFTNAENRSKRTGDTLMLSEFGASKDIGVLRRMIDRADRYLISWQEWHYCACKDPTTTGAGDTQATVIDPALPPTGTNVNAEKLRVYAQAYPQAVAGTLRRTAFDEERRVLSFEYDPSSRGRAQETEVALPKLQYPDGYDVDVDGAGVVSAPGDSTLRLQACDGLGKLVQVAVKPGTGRVSQTCRIARTTPAAGSPGATSRRSKLTVRPRTVVAGRRTRFRLQLTPARRAVVRFAGRRVRTDAKGRARVTRRFNRTGRYRLRGAGARASVRVIR